MLLLLWRCWCCVLVVVMLLLLVRGAHQRPGRLALLKQPETRARLAVIVVVRLRLWWRSLAQLRHQTHVLLIDLVRTGHDARLLRATVLGNVPGTAADRAEDVVGHIRLVRTQPALVLCGAAVVAARRVRLAQRAVQLRQLPQLHAAQVVVTLGHLNALLDHILDPVHGLLHRLCIAGRDERVQRLILARQRLPVLAAHLALLHGALAANYDLGARVLLHRLQRVAARSNQQADKVDVGVLFLRNEDLVADTDHWGSAMSRRRLIKYNLSIKVVRYP